MFLTFILFLLKTVLVFANLEGPYIVWGPKNLELFKKPALKPLGQDELMRLYGDHEAIVVFNNQDSAPLFGGNFPRLRKSLEGKPLLVLPQSFLEVHPDYVCNETQVFTLQGPSCERDAEITETFDRLEDIYGKGNVLAILGNSASQDYNDRLYFDSDSSGSFRRRREAEKEEEENKEDKKIREKDDDGYALYYPSTSAATVKAMLYSSSWPVLKMNETGETIVLKNPTVITIHTSPKEDQKLKKQLIATHKTSYMNANVTIRLKFRFDKIQPDYWWSMGGVEVEIIGAGLEENVLLKLPQFADPPSAQIGKSYHCSAPLVFTGSKGTLTLEDIQFEAFLDSAKFSDAYDCAGFFTVPIWSGIGVTFLLGIALSISVIMIMDIKTMDKFDSTKGRMLTITVNE